MSGIKGNEICISEWPFGCEIYNKGKRKEGDYNSILIRSVEDAKIVIESLTRMVEIFDKKV